MSWTAGHSETATYTYAVSQKRLLLLLYPRDNGAYHVYCC